MMGYKDQKISHEEKKRERKRKRKRNKLRQERCDNEM